jgi:outer membrane receptor protein involved in Fe transport
VGLAKISMGSWVYDAGASYACGKQVTLFTSLATGFRAPNLDDLGSLGIVDFRYEYPAYALKPEKSFTKNVGIRAHSAKWNAEFVAFHTNIQDMITRVKTSSVAQGYPVYRKENNVEAYLYGLEWVQQIRLAEHWSLANQLSYTLGQNVTLNEPMRRIPPLFGNLSISYQGPKISTMIRWQGAARQTRLSAGDKSDNRMDPSGTAGWGIVNVHSTLQISPHIRVGMQGENLGNVRYRMHGSGIDGMGRSLHVQLNYLW